MHATLKTLELWKKNEVFKAVQTAGFNPEEFDWDDDEEILRHPSSGAYFVFGGVPRKYIVRYKSGDDPERGLEKYTWDASNAKRQGMACERKGLHRDT